MRQSLTPDRWLEYTLAVGASIEDWTSKALVLQDQSSLGGAGRSAP
ncbi:hypothetical protein LP415_23730 [Polaromonas sp. P1(28)-8]|nr:hypothetical protein LP415_23730 [Polaromonas sp. P1(28)-8]